MQGAVLRQWLDACQTVQCAKVADRRTCCWHSRLFFLPSTCVSPSKKLPISEFEGDGSGTIQITLVLSSPIQPDCELRSVQVTLGVIVWKDCVNVQQHIIVASNSDSYSPLVQVPLSVWIAKEKHRPRLACHDKYTFVRGSWITPMHVVSSRFDGEKLDSQTPAPVVSTITSMCIRTCPL